MKTSMVVGLLALGLASCSIHPDMVESLQKAEFEMGCKAQVLLVRAEFGTRQEPLLYGKYVMAQEGFNTIIYSPATYIHLNETQRVQAMKGALEGFCR